MYKDGNITSPLVAWHNRRRAYLPGHPNAHALDSPSLKPDLASAYRQHALKSETFSKILTKTAVNTDAPGKTPTAPLFIKRAAHQAEIEIRRLGCRTPHACRKGMEGLEDGTRTEAETGMVHMEEPGGTDENAMFSQTESHVVRLNRRKRFLRQPIISRSIARVLVWMPESLGIYVDDVRSS
jgi:hypothetical protein